MGKYRLGNTSKARLATCHKKIQQIVEDAIKTSPIDFGVVCGFRGETLQTEAFLNHKSKAQWGESAHNFRCGNKPCSLAVDLAPYSSKINNYLWNDEGAFQALYDHIMLTASKFSVELKWGGNFRSFKDRPHFEIVI